MSTERGYFPSSLRPDEHSAARFLLPCSAQSVFLLLGARCAPARTGSLPPLGAHTWRSLAAALRRVTQITSGTGGGPARLGSAGQKACMHTFRTGLRGPTGTLTVQILFRKGETQQRNSRRRFFL